MKSESNTVKTVIPIGSHNEWEDDCEDVDPYDKDDDDENYIETAFSSVTSSNQIDEIAALNQIILSKKQKISEVENSFRLMQQERDVLLEFIQVMSKFIIYLVSVY